MSQTSRKSFYTEQLTLQHVNHLKAAYDEEHQKNERLAAEREKLLLSISDLQKSLDLSVKKSEILSCSTLHNGKPVEIVKNFGEIVGSGDCMGISCCIRLGKCWSFVGPSHMHKFRSEEFELVSQTMLFNEPVSMASRMSLELFYCLIDEVPKGHRVKDANEIRSLGSKVYDTSSNSSLRSSYIREGPTIDMPIQSPLSAISPKSFTFSTGFPTKAEANSSPAEVTKSTSEIRDIIAFPLTRGFIWLVPTHGRVFSELGASKENGDQSMYKFLGEITELLHVGSHVVLSNVVTHYDREKLLSDSVATKCCDELELLFQSFHSHSLSSECWQKIPVVLNKVLGDTMSITLSAMAVAGEDSLASISSSLQVEEITDLHCLEARCLLENESFHEYLTTPKFCGTRLACPMWELTGDSSEWVSTSNISCVANFHLTGNTTEDLLDRCEAVAKQIAPRIRRWLEQSHLAPLNLCKRVDTSVITDFDHVQLLRSYIQSGSFATVEAFKSMNSLLASRLKCDWVIAVARYSDSGDGFQSLVVINNIGQQHSVQLSEMCPQVQKVVVNILGSNDSQDEPFVLSSVANGVQIPSCVVKELLAIEPLALHSFASISPSLHNIIGLSLQDTSDTTFTERIAFIAGRCLRPFVETVVLRDVEALNEIQIFAADCRRMNHMFSTTESLSQQMARVALAREQDEQLEVFQSKILHLFSESALKLSKLSKSTVSSTFQLTRAECNCLFEGLLDAAFLASLKSGEDDSTTDSVSFGKIPFRLELREAVSKDNEWTNWVLGANGSWEKALNNKIGKQEIYPLSELTPDSSRKKPRGNSVASSIELDQESQLESILLFRQLGIAGCEMELCLAVPDTIYRGTMTWSVSFPSSLWLQSLSDVITSLLQNSSLNQHIFFGSLSNNHEFESSSEFSTGFSVGLKSIEACMIFGESISEYPRNSYFLSHIQECAPSFALLTVNPGSEEDNGFIVRYGDAPLNLSARAKKLIRVALLQNDERKADRVDEASADNQFSSCLLRVAGLGALMHHAVTDVDDTVDISSSSSVYLYAMNTGSSLDCCYCYLLVPRGNMLNTNCHLTQVKFFLDQALLPLLASVAAKPQFDSLHCSQAILNDCLRTCGELIQTSASALAKYLDEKEDSFDNEFVSNFLENGEDRVSISIASTLIKSWAVQARQLFEKTKETTFACYILQGVQRGRHQLNHVLGDGNFPALDLSAGSLDFEPSEFSRGYSVVSSSTEEFPMPNDGEFLGFGVLWKEILVREKSSNQEYVFTIVSIVAPAACVTDYNVEATLHVNWTSSSSSGRQETIVVAAIVFRALSNSFQEHCGSPSKMHSSAKHQLSSSSSKYLKDYSRNPASPSRPTAHGGSKENVSMQSLKSSLVFITRVVGGYFCPLLASASEATRVADFLRDHLDHHMDVGDQKHEALEGIHFTLTEMLDNTSTKVRSPMVSRSSTPPLKSSSKFTFDLPLPGDDKDMASTTPKKKKEKYNEVSSRVSQEFEIPRNRDIKGKPTSQSLNDELALIADNTPSGKRKVQFFPAADVDVTSLNTSDHSPRYSGDSTKAHDPTLSLGMRSASDPTAFDINSSLEAPSNQLTSKLGPSIHAPLSKEHIHEDASEQRASSGGETPMKSLELPVSEAQRQTKLPRAISVATDISTVPAASVGSSFASAQTPRRSMTPRSSFVVSPRPSQNLHVIHESAVLDAVSKAKQQWEKTDADYRELKAINKDLQALLSSQQEKIDAFNSFLSKLERLFSSRASTFANFIGSIPKDSSAENATSRLETKLESAIFDILFLSMISDVSIDLLCDFGCHDELIQAIRAKIMRILDSPADLNFDQASWRSTEREIVDGSNNDFVVLWLHDLKWQQSENGVFPILENIVRPFGFAAEEILQFVLKSGKAAFTESRKTLGLDEESGLGRDGSTTTLVPVLSSLNHSSKPAISAAVQYTSSTEKAAESRRVAIRVAAARKVFQSAVGRIAESLRSKGILCPWETLESVASEAVEHDESAIEMITDGIDPRNESNLDSFVENLGIVIAGLVHSRCCIFLPHGESFRENDEEIDVLSGVITQISNGHPSQCRTERAHMERRRLSFLANTVPGQINLTSSILTRKDREADDSSFALVAAIDISTFEGKKSGNDIFGYILVEVDHFPTAECVRRFKACHKLVASLLSSSRSRVGLRRFYTELREKTQECARIDRQDQVKEFQVKLSACLHQRTMEPLQNINGMDLFLRTLEEAIEMTVPSLVRSARISIIRLERKKVSAIADNYRKLTEETRMKTESSLVNYEDLAALSLVTNDVIFREQFQFGSSVTNTTTSDIVGWAFVPVACFKRKRPKGSEESHEDIELRDILVSICLEFNSQDSWADFKAVIEAKGRDSEILTLAKISRAFIRDARKSLLQNRKVASLKGTSVISGEVNANVEAVCRMIEEGRIKDMVSLGACVSFLFDRKHGKSVCCHQARFYWKDTNHGSEAWKTSEIVLNFSDDTEISRVSNVLTSTRKDSDCKPEHRALDVFLKVGFWKEQICPNIINDIFSVIGKFDGLLLGISETSVGVQTLPAVHADRMAEDDESIITSSGDFAPSIIEKNPQAFCGKAVRTLWFNLSSFGLPPALIELNLDETIFLTSQDLTTNGFEVAIPAAGFRGPNLYGKRMDCNEAVLWCDEMKSLQLVRFSLSSALEEFHLKYLSVVEHLRHQHQVLLSRGQMILLANCLSEIAAESGKLHDVCSAVQDLIGLLPGVYSTKLICSDSQDEMLLYENDSSNSKKANDEFETSEGEGVEHNDRLVRGRTSFRTPKDKTGEATETPHSSSISRVRSSLSPSPTRNRPQKSTEFLSTRKIVDREEIEFEFECFEIHGRLLLYRRTTEELIETNALMDSVFQDGVNFEGSMKIPEDVSRQLLAENVDCEEYRLTEQHILQIVTRSLARRVYELHRGQKNKRILQAKQREIASQRTRLIENEATRADLLKEIDKSNKDCERLRSLLTEEQEESRRMLSNHKGFEKKMNAVIADLKTQNSRLEAVSKKSIQTLKEERRVATEKAEALARDLGRALERDRISERARREAVNELELLQKQSKRSGNVNEEMARKMRNELITARQDLSKASCREIELKGESELKMKSVLTKLQQTEGEVARSRSTMSLLRRQLDNSEAELRREKDETSRLKQQLRAQVLENESSKQLSEIQVQAAREHALAASEAFRSEQSKAQQLSDRVHGLELANVSMTQKWSDVGELLGEKDKIARLEAIIQRDEDALETAGTQAEKELIRQQRVANTQILGLLYNRLVSLEATVQTQVQGHQGFVQIVTLSEQSLEDLAEAIDRKIRDKRRHQVSASGIATGVPTPPPPTSDPTSNMVTYGPLTLTRLQYLETVRYFELFQDAIADAYPSGGYSIGTHEPSGQFVVKGRTSADTFKFAFDPDAIKNHYLCFRLLNDFDNYLAHARRQAGVDNNVGAVSLCKTAQSGTLSE